MSENDQATFDEFAIRESLGKATDEEKGHLHENIQAWRDTLIAIKLRIESDLTFRKSKIEGGDRVPKEEYQAYIKWKANALYIKKHVEIALPRVTRLLKEANVVTAKEVNKKDSKHCFILLWQARAMIPLSEMTKAWHDEVSALLDSDKEPKR